MKHFLFLALAALLSSLFSPHAFATQLLTTYNVQIDDAGQFGSGVMTLTGDDTAPALGTYYFSDVSGSGPAFVGIWASANFEYVPSQGLGEFLVKGQNQNGFFALSFSVPPDLTVFQALQATVLGTAVTINPVPDICGTFLLFGFSVCGLGYFRRVFTDHSAEQPLP